MGGSTIFDWWLGEQLDKRERYRKRHKRDGLCLDCKRKALPNRTRCQKHHDRDLETTRKYREAMKLGEKGKRDEPDLLI